MFFPAFWSSSSLHSKSLLYCSKYNCSPSHSCWKEVAFESAKYSSFKSFSNVLLNLLNSTCSLERSSSETVGSLQLQKYNIEIVKNRCSTYFLWFASQGVTEIPVAAVLQLLLLQVAFEFEEMLLSLGLGLAEVFIFKSSYWVLQWTTSFSRFEIRSSGVWWVGTVAWLVSLPATLRVSSLPSC